MTDPVDLPLLPSPTPEDADGDGELAALVESMWCSDNAEDCP